VGAGRDASEPRGLVPRRVCVLRVADAAQSRRERVHRGLEPARRASSSASRGHRAQALLSRRHRELRPDRPSSTAPDRPARASSCSRRCRRPRRRARPRPRGAVEAAVGVGRATTPPARATAARNEPVHAKGHRARRPLRQVVRLQPDQDARRAYERLPVDGELRALLRARHVARARSPCCRRCGSSPSARRPPRRALRRRRSRRGKRDVDRLLDVA
jgi:hypothetical protein